MYELAEELTAAFSRLEPSMQPVLLIQYGGDAQNQLMSSSTQQNNSTINPVITERSYTPYAVTGSSLRSDEADEIVSSEKKEDLDIHKLEELNVQTEREKPGMVVMRGSPSFVTVGGIRFDDDEEVEKDQQQEKLKKKGRKETKNNLSRSQKRSQHKYMVLTLDAHKLSLRTYGVSSHRVDKFASTISQLLSWAKSRIHLLQQVLHQKMGLFSHSTTERPTKIPVIVEGGGKHKAIYNGIFRF